MQREEKSQTGDMRREVDVGRVQGRVQTTRHGCSQAPGARQRKRMGCQIVIGREKGAGQTATGRDGQKNRGGSTSWRRRIILVICSEGEISKALFYYY